MADSLFPFINSLVERLSADPPLTPEQALVAMGQYKYLREQIDIYVDRLDPAVMADEKAFRLALSIFLRRISAQEALKSKIISQGDLAPDNVYDKNDEIIARADGLLRASRASAVILKTRREKFVHDIVTRYSRRLNLPIDTQEALAQSLSQISSTASDDDVSQAVMGALAGFQQSGGANQREVTRVGDEITQQFKDEKGVSAAVSSAIILSQNPVAFTTVLEQKLERPKAAQEAKKIIADTKTLIQTYEALTAKEVPSAGATLQVEKINFFQAVSKSPLARVADAALNSLPTDKLEVINAVFQQSFARVSANTAGLTQKFGPEFVGSALFKGLVEDGQQTFGARSSKVTSALGRVLASAPLGRLVGRPDGFFESIFELNKRGLFSTGFLSKEVFASSAAPALDGGHVLGAVFESFAKHRGSGVALETVFVWRKPDTYVALFQHAPSFVYHFEFAKDIGGWIFRLGIRQGLKKTAFATAGKTLVAGASRALFARLGGAALGATIGSAVPVLGTIAGAIAGFLAEKLLGRITRFFGGLFGRGGSKSDSLAALAGPIALVFAVVLFFFYSSSKNDTDITSAIVNSARSNTGGGENITGSGQLCDEKTGQCPVSFCKSDKSKCPWPTHGCITQGPFAGGSHARENAIDIANDNIGTPVAVTHAGTVTFVRDEYVNGDHTAPGYGNFVEIEGKDENGRSFITLYAHLMRGVPVSKNQQVSAGQTIGHMDDTGNSSGSHLHYEYLQGGSINDILPIAVPGCVGAECKAQLGAQTCF